MAGWMLRALIAIAAIVLALIFILFGYDFTWVHDRLAVGFCLVIAVVAAALMDTFA